MPKNAILCVRVISDQLCDANGPPSQVQHDELATGLSFGDTVEFPKAVVFVLHETLVQLDDGKAVNLKALLGMLSWLPWGRRDTLGSMDG